MSQYDFNQAGLSGDQLLRLCEFLTEKYGNRLTKPEFSDHVLLLLEDISGFEFVSDSEARRIINKLWSLYHDQSK